MTTTRRRLLLLLALLAFPSNLFAHRLDEYLQATLVVIEPADIRLLMNLTPGVAVAEQVIDLIDQDRDGMISTGETTAYAESLKRDILVRLDNRRLDLKLTESEFPKPTELRSGWGIIRIEFSLLPGSLRGGVHTLTLENQHLPDVSVYLVNAALPKSETIQITRQRRNEDQSAASIEFTFHRPTNSSKALGTVAWLAVPLAAVFAGVWRMYVHKESRRTA